MTPVQAVWFSSAVGAALFAVAGYFVAAYLASRRRPVFEPSTSAPSPERGELESLRAELRAAQAREAKLGAEVGALQQGSATRTGDLERVATERDRLRAELESAKRVAAEATAHTRELEAKAARVQELEAKAARVQELEARAARIPELEAKASRAAELEARAAHAAELEAKAARAAELEEAATRVTELEEELAQRENADTQVRADPRVLATMERDLHQAKTELARIEAERGRLAAESSKLKQELSAAQAERSTLRSELSQAKANAAARDAAPAPVAAAARGTSHTTLVGIQDPAALLEQSQGELRRARAAAEEAEHALASVRADLERTQLEATGLREAERAAAATAAERDRLQHEASEQRARLAALDGKLAQAARGDEERLELRQQLKELQQKLAELEPLRALVDERHELALRIESLQQKEQEALALRDEKAHLTDRLRETLTDQEALQAKLRALEAAAGDRQELAIKVALQSEQLAQLLRLKEESHSLREAAGERDELRRKLEELTAQNATLRSMATVSDRPPRPIFDAPGESFGGSLQKLLDTILQDERTRGAVLADESGLVVAGTGGDVEALAAAAAIILDNANKLLKNVLPLAGLQQLSLVDENALTLAAQPFRLPGNQLILATLSVGPGPDPARVSQLISEANAAYSPAE